MKGAAGAGGGGGWEAGGGLHPPIGLFGVAMSPRSVGYRPRQDWRALRDVSPTRVNITRIPPIQCPPWVPLSQS